MYFPIDDSPNKLYQQIGATIKEYYPLGLERNSKEYNEYPGIVKIEDKINYQMLNYNNYIKPWKSFLANLPRGYKSKVRDHSFAHEISFNGEMMLEQFENERVQIVKKLLFSVSGIGNYFNIHGIDETCLKLNDDETSFQRGVYNVINAVTISPYMEFQAPFYYIYDSIIKHFTGYNFISFSNCQIVVEGLQTPYSNMNECTVYNALFRDIYDYSPISNLRGNRFYKFGGNTQQL